jgi:hypothetical protein
MTTMAMARGHTWTFIAIGAGVLVGLAYTLSPLTVLSLAVLAWAATAASRGLSESERRWFWSLLSIAVVIRLISIALLFWSADPSRPFASFFGDEELYKFRSVWVRNVGQSIPISPADLIYSYDPVGRTSYMYVLALVQALVGDAPYGLHLFNMMLYLCGTLALFRVMRGAYGSPVAMAGLITLLFLPSLALWSISVLKEPMNVLMIVGELVCAVWMVRTPHWWQKLSAAFGVVVFGLAMESLRGGGLITAGVGAIGGIAIAYVMSRGRRLAVTMLTLPVAVAVLASVPAVQDRILATLRMSAFHHAGHVLTPGYSYQLVNPRYYARRVMLINQMPPVDAGRFAARAVWSYVAEPLPWKMESRMLLAYLPEQIVWYVMAALLPIGVVAGLRRDVVMTAMLTSHAAAAILIVALTSGNIGTLIRHRTLALPYLVWLSALGAQACLRRFVDGRRVDEEGSRVDGNR